MKKVLELQLMRDWQPRSRPSAYEVEIGNPDPVFCKLVPGAAAEGMETMFAVIEGLSRVGERWCTARVALTIDRTQFGEPRPVMFYLGESSAPTGIVHYPVLAGDGNKMFRGHHSLLVRCA